MAEGNAKRNALGFGGAVGIVAAAVGVLMWLGFSPTQQVTRAEVETKIERLESAAHHKADIDRMERIYERQDAKLDLILQRLPRR